MPISTMVSTVGVVASLAAGVTLTALLVIPPPAPAHAVWFDAPLDQTQLEPGEHRIVLHLSEKEQAARLVITRDGDQVGSLVDDDLEPQPQPPARTAWRAEFTFDFAEGRYHLDPVLNGSTTPAGAGIDIVVGDPPPAAEETVTPSATPDAAETPSATPTPSATAVPIPTAAPSNPAAPPPPPVSTPTPSAPPPAPNFSGTVTRSPASSGRSNYSVSGISPSNASAYVQERVLDSPTGPVVRDWTNFACTPTSGTVAPWSCAVSNVSAAQYNLTYTIEYRLMLSYNGTVWTGPVGSFLRLQQVN